jgi:hypothetical protein
MFIIDSFYPSTTGRYIMFAASAAVYGIAFGAVKQVNRWISAMLLLLGAAVLVSNDAEAADWLNAWLNNAPVICLLLTVSLFTIPLHFEPYQAVLAGNLPRFAKSPFQLYAITLSVTTILASLLNIASLPFVHTLLSDTAAKYQEGIVAKALIRGTSINMLWSPAFISVAIVIQYTESTWFELLPSGLLLATAGLLVAMLFGGFEFNRQAAAGAQPAAADFKLVLAKLLLQLAMLIVFIVGLQSVTQKSALVTVPLVSFTGPLLLALAFSRLTVYRNRLKTYFTTSLPDSYGELILFTAFGFFGFALGLSNSKQYILPAIQHLGFDAPIILIPLITALAALPCLFGIHPIVTISTIVITLPPGSIALTKAQMAGALLLSYMAYGNLSPFSAVNLVIAGLTKADSLSGFRQNWLYVLAVVFVGTLILTYLPL